MSLTWILIIIAIVLGVIIGNILLLKHSANLKMPADKAKKIENEDDEDSGW